MAKTSYRRRAGTLDGDSFGYTLPGGRAVLLPVKSGEVSTDDPDVVAALDLDPSWERSREAKTPRDQNPDGTPKEP